MHNQSLKLDLTMHLNFKNSVKTERNIAQDYQENRINQSRLRMSLLFPPWTRAEKLGNLYALYRALYHCMPEFLIWLIKAVRSIHCPSCYLGPPELLRNATQCIPSRQVLRVPAARLFTSPSNWNPILWNYLLLRFDKSTTCLVRSRH